MQPNLSPIETAKFVASKRAVDFVESGMKVGLGTGSTAAWMVRCLGDLVRNDGLKITGVATSLATAELAQSVGIPIVTLDQAGWLDLTIDGADEFDAKLQLIKGGGAALLREKIVASASDRMIVIADDSKQVDILGAFPLPVEVIPFGWKATQKHIEEHLVHLNVGGRDISLRMSGDTPLRTDQGNYILDLQLDRFENAYELESMLNLVPGVVENGLFIDICDVVVIGNDDGSVEVRDISKGTVEHEQIDVTDTDNLFVDIAD